MGNAQPLSGSDADVCAAHNAVLHDVYWNLDAMYRGRCPGELADTDEVKALFAEGYGKNLAEIHAAGSDFIGVNHYRVNWARHDDGRPFGYSFVYDIKLVPVTETTGIA